MANLLTATVDNTYAHVLLHVEYDAIGSTTAVVERSADGGVTWTAVRGSPLTLVGPDPAAGQRIANVYDSEAPFNTALTYRATSNFGVVVTAGPVTITVASGVSWMKDPARPWANLKISECVRNAFDVGCLPAPAEPALFVVYSGLGDQSRASDATLFPILNRSRPADVYAYRKDVVTSWQVASVTLTAANSIVTFYALGGPIFLQLDPSYGWPDRYYQPGDVNEQRLSGDLTQPFRLWPAPLTVVDQPAGAAQGVVENTWCALKATYGTWGNLAATTLTWGNVVAGDAIATDGYGFGPYGDGPYGDGG